MRSELDVSKFAFTASEVRAELYSSPPSTVVK